MDAVVESGARPRTLGLALIPAEEVRKVAHLVRSLVENACKFSGGRFDPDEVIAACAGENPNWKAQLWISGYSGGGEPTTLDSIAVTQISIFSTGLRVLEVALVAGRDAHSWLQYEDRFVDWAAKQGCTRMQMIGRRGWAKVLSRPWRESARMFERVIEARGADGAN
jgi:hypothetical protein